MEFINLLAPVVIIATTVFAALAFIFRLRVERRVGALLAEHPEVRHASVDLELRSIFAWNRKRAIDAKIAEMQSGGWTFLRAMPASQRPTIRFWRGGLTLHFIRTYG